MVEAMTVGTSQHAEPRSHLFQILWYLSSLKNIFCREFPANVVILVTDVGWGGGVPLIFSQEAKRETPSAATLRTLFPCRNPQCENSKPQIRHASSPRSSAAPRPRTINRATGESKVVKAGPRLRLNRAGGDIRIAVQKRLLEMAENGRIRGCIFGENWSKSDEMVWKLLQSQPQLKQDSDLGRRNRGITIVLL